MDQIKLKKVSINDIWYQLSVFLETDGQKCFS